MREIEYFHIELETHEVVFAEGAAVETLLVSTDRERFDNFIEYERLYGNSNRQPMTPYAPIVGYYGRRSEFIAKLRRTASKSSILATQSKLRLIGLRLVPGSWSAELRLFDQALELVRIPLRPLLHDLGEIGADLGATAAVALGGFDGKPGIDPAGDQSLDARSRPRDRVDPLAVPMAGPVGALAVHGSMAGCGRARLGFRGRYSMIEASRPQRLSASCATTPADHRLQSQDPARPRQRWGRGD